MSRLSSTAKEVNPLFNPLPQMNSISCLTDIVQETVHLLLRKGNWMCSLNQGKRLNCVVIKTLRNTFNRLYNKMDNNSHNTGNRPPNCIYCSKT
ncbi:hypothetical protein AMECASPLE_026403 [Ameca splendens]|uniref:Uncharacterized protein n=1 Tax=Ameca splendens TaxID=208324 RepID=A0ABV0YG23_9TELE